MVLTQEDLKFIAKEIKLDISKAKSLTEEDNDLNLVINELSLKNFSRKKLEKLSLPLIIRYFVFRFSRPYEKLSFEEKVYVANIIEKYFIQIAKSTIFNSFKGISKESSEYSFVLLGFFSGKLSQEEYVKYKKYLKFFQTNDEYLTFYRNLDVWFEIFLKMKTGETF